jgi:hypothetical protein
MDPGSFSRTREWSDRVGGWDLRQYVVNNVEVTDAVVMGTLFWPGFMENMEFVEKSGKWAAFRRLCLEAIFAIHWRADMASRPN